MARKSGLGAVALSELANAPVGNYQQAIAALSTNYSNYNAVAVDRSIKFIAIPPIQSSVVAINTRGGPMFAPVGFSNHLALEGPPFAVEVYRDDEFFMSFGSTTDTQIGAWVPGGVQKAIALDPGLVGDTLAICATVGTSPLRVSFLQ